MEYEILATYYDYDEGTNELNIENKGVHDLINEYGARLDEFERDDARLILNDLYQSGYDDYWICIAFTRILDKGSFNQWKYLLKFDDFIKENTYIYLSDYKNVSLKEMIEAIDDLACYATDIKLSNKESNDIAFLWNELLKKNPQYNINDFKNIIEYYYFKHYLSAPMCYYTLTIKLEPKLTKFENWYRGLSAGEKRKLIDAGLLKS